MNTCIINVPYSLFLRITRICSEEDKKEKRFEELKQMLLDRKYPEQMINSARNRARKITREQALQIVAKTTTIRRPVFVVTWDPRLPSLQAIVQKHWRTMSSVDPYLQEVYQEPPLVAFKRQKNIKDFVIRAKVPPKMKRNPKREIPGMRKCNKPCQACPYIKEQKQIETQKFTWKINSHVNCESKNIVYIIECSKENCKMKYIGETERTLAERLEEHRGYINQNKLNKSTGNHLNSRGHSISNLNISILEKVKSNETLYRKEREKYLIRKFNTHYNGLNGNEG